MRGAAEWRQRIRKVLTAGLENETEHQEHCLELIQKPETHPPFSCLLKLETHALLLFHMLKLELVSQLTHAALSETELSMVKLLTMPSGVKTDIYDINR